MRVLILGGTAEAAALARLLAGDARFETTLSLAGATRRPRPQPVATRIGGFGGADGLARHLTGHGGDVLVDATHPFAANMSGTAAAAAAAAAVPLLAIRRPAWQPAPGDRWTEVADTAEAAAALGPGRRVVFLTIGRKDLSPFRAAPQHRYVVRSVDAPPAGLLPPDCLALQATGPFEAAGERALLAEHGIEVVVTKNSGGDATSAKLAAARDLGLPVVMVRRPAKPAVEAVATAGEAHRWLLAHAAASGARRGV